MQKGRKSEKEIIDLLVGAKEEEEVASAEEAKSTKESPKEEQIDSKKGTSKQEKKVNRADTKMEIKSKQLTVGIKVVNRDDIKRILKAAL